MALSLLKKLVRAVSLLLVVTLVTFALMYGNATGIAQGTLSLGATPEDVQRRVVELGLDRPFLVQYFDWFLGALRGDLGTSYFTGQEVTDALQTRVPVTLALVVITLLLTIVLCIALGVAAAYFGGWIDRVVQFVSGAGSAVPPFIVAVVLVFAFAVANPIFPATGYVRPERGLDLWVASITLPVIALLVGAIAGSAAQIRGAVIDTLNKDFVRTLRARGHSEFAIVFRNVLRSASGPGLIAFGLITIALFGGTIFVEQVFALPGIGQLANLSAQQGDIPMVMGVVLVTILIVLVVNLLADIANVMLNPKARTR